jgi:Outer membrane protein beta-barrel domain
MHKIFTIIALTALTTLTATAQKARFGIKVGLNLSNTLQAAETDANNKALETTEIASGFLVGMTAELPLGDYFGVGAEALYAQRGNVYRYDGAGFYNFHDANAKTYSVDGTLRVIMKNTNGYVELPLMVYVKPIKHLKIEAGLSPSLLIASQGAGEFFLHKLTYTGGSSSAVTLRDTQLIIAQNFDYTQSAEKQGNLDGNTTTTTPQTVDILGETYAAPRNVGAYYFYPAKQGNYFNAFDLGANLGVNYTFGSGLNFGLRGTYGLFDITNNYYDQYRSKNTGAPDYKAIARPTDVRNFNIALSLGFRF